MNYCGACKDHEECRATGCSNPRRHPQQMTGEDQLVRLKVYAKEEQVYVEKEELTKALNLQPECPMKYYSQFVQLKWGEYTHKGTVFLEVRTANGWQPVYPLIERYTPPEEVTI